MSQVYISILNFSPLSPHWNIRLGRLSPWSSRHIKLSRNCISNFLGSTRCLSLFRRWQFHLSGCSGQKSWKIYLYPLFFPSYSSSSLSKCHWCHLENTSRVILRQHDLCYCSELLSGFQFFPHTPSTPARMVQPLFSPVQCSRWHSK